MTVIPPARPVPSPRSPRARVRGAVPAVALAAAALAVAGCGADDQATTNAAATTSGTAPRPALADDVPARSAAFAAGSIRPGGDAKAAIDQVVGLIGGASRGGALVERLRLGDDLLPKGRTIEDDVLPHLGDHVAAFLLGGDAPKPGTRTAAKDVDGALVAEVRDGAALRRAVGTRGKATTVDGQTVRITGDRAVWIGDEVAATGSERAVRAAIAAAGGPDLAGNDRFTGALEQVRTTNPVGVAWIDLQQTPALNAAFRELTSSAGALAAKGSKRSRGSKARSSALGSLPRGLRDRVQQQLGVAGSARGSARTRGFRVALPSTDATAASALELAPGRLVVRSGGTGAKPVADPTVAADAVASLPAGSWAAFGGGTSGVLAAGSSGATAFDRLTSILGTKLPAGLRDALAGVETVSGGVQGQNLLAASGAVVLRAKDDAGAKALLKQVGDGLSSAGRAGKARRGPFGGRDGLTAKPTTIPGTSEALVVGLAGLPLQIAAGVQGDRLAIGLGADSVTKALAEDKRFSSDPLYARAKDALGGTAPSLVVQPQPLADLLSSLGDGLGGLLGGLGGGRGSAGIGGLLGNGGSGATSGGRTGGLLGSGGLTRVLDAVGRVKLVTAGREKTGDTTWRGTLVVEYDGSAPKAKTTP